MSFYYIAHHIFKEKTLGLLFVGACVLDLWSPIQINILKVFPVCDGVSESVNTFDFVHHQQDMQFFNS